MSDGDLFSSCLYRQHLQLTLEFVDVEVATTQVTHSAVELERVAAMHHSPVVVARHVTWLQSDLQSRRRPIHQASERRVRLVIRLNIVLRDVEWSLERWSPRHADDAASLRLGDNVWTSVSVIQENNITKHNVLIYVTNAYTTYVQHLRDDIVIK